MISTVLFYPIIYHVFRRFYKWKKLVFYSLFSYPYYYNANHRVKYKTVKVNKPKQTVIVVKEKQKNRRTKRYDVTRCMLLIINNIMYICVCFQADKDFNYPGATAKKLWENCLNLYSHQ
jgi:hypothetical protein